MNLKKDNEQYILMITNHGVHEWQITPGLADTGGQNLFVNQFTDTLSDIGFLITIANRGGYSHPLTGQPLKGSVYKNGNRIVYLEDGIDTFVRKEDMHESIEQLAVFLADFIAEDERIPDLIISHYWDSAAIALRLSDLLDTDIRHIWVPHSLGRIKSSKTSADEDIKLRMSERIEAEIRILQKIDTVVATSETVKQSLIDDYSFSGRIPFIPPCIDDSRYRPFNVSSADRIYSLLSEAAVRLTAAEAEKSMIIAEVSRTDTTKRKDVLIRAFASVMNRHPAALLAVTIDRECAIGAELIELIEALGAEGRVAVLGSIWEQLPALYNIADIYCSPSVMEGFGMSVQEAAACRTAIVASDRIPFVSEYLTPASGSDEEGGALIVAADDVEGFAAALERLLDDASLRDTIAENAYRRTIPYFTWPRAVRQFLGEGM